MDNCKCDKDKIRITFHGESYCWACYDEALKADDFTAARELLHKFANQAIDNWHYYDGRPKN